jgi:hypothetical protein
LYGGLVGYGLAMTVFRVDDVPAVRTRLPSRRLAELAGEVLAVGGDPELRVLEPDGVHPLLSAVGRAFAEHRPLVLSPDAVWLTIAQGVAQHVRLHAEELRPRLVSHPGRKRLTATLDGPMPAEAGSWARAVEMFAKLLAAEARDAGAFECDFSTSTDVERTAGRIVLMDAYSPYFALWMKFVCGIPSITLTGTAGDWQKIRDRVQVIAGFGLEDWCRSLAPITAQFARAASGDVDVAFWRRIYSPADAYGSEVITGWIARLYPYLTMNGVAGEPNPLLDLPIDQPRDLTAGGRSGYQGPGIRSDQVPAVLSKVTVNVNDIAGGDNRVVALHAGLAGVAQDDDGALRPVAGWHLASAATDINEVIDRLIASHQVTPPSPARMWFWHTPAEVTAIYDRIGSATLFGGTWRLLPVAEQCQAWITDSDRSILAIINLPDGRSIAATTDQTGQVTHWIACRLTETKAGPRDPAEWRPRQARLADDPADVPVYGTSLALLLDAALDSGGDIAHLETTRLSQLT